MKLVRFGPKGAEKPGIVASDGSIRDLSGKAADFEGKGLSLEALAAIAALDPLTLPKAPDGVRFGSCVAATRNFIAVGLNYADHAAESGMAVPKSPVFFNKVPSCLSGPDDDVVIPPGSLKSDWEVELAFVIGKAAYNITAAEAPGHIAGFALCNDLSERAWQLEDTGQWVKGKSAPGFGPLGPWLVTPDELGNPHELDMFLDLNGKRVQTGNTRTMVFNCYEIIAAMSKFWRLEPGDIVTTGTPPGVGMGMKPPVFLKPGDTMRLGIAGLGEQNQKVVAAG